MRRIGVTAGGLYRPGLWRVCVLVALAVVTLLYFFSSFFDDAGSALSQWQHRWRVLLLCLGLNWIGISLDFVCWVWMYRRCGVRVPALTSPLIFLSLYAAYVLPAQAGRLLRPDAAARLGHGKLRDGLEAEAALMYLDICGTLTLLSALLAWHIAPWLAPLSAAAMLSIALAAGGLASSISRKRFVHVRAGLFWSLRGAITALLRAADRALLGLVLLLLIAPFAPQVDYPTAALYVLTADALGAMSGLPGGAVVVEGMLAFLLQWSALPQEHIAIAVTVFRVLYFWSLVPIGWAALMLTFAIARRNNLENPPHV